VFADILRFLFRVPFEFHRKSVAGLSPFANPVIASSLQERLSKPSAGGWFAE
jgi:hypothetical protein